jgi:L-asparaginase II
MNDERTAAEQKLVEAAEEVLRESKAKAVVIMTDAKGEGVVAIGDSDALPPMIEAASQPMRMLAEMSADEQRAFLESASTNPGNEGPSEDGSIDATPPSLDPGNED